MNQPMKAWAGASMAAVLSAIATGCATTTTPRPIPLQPLTLMELRSGSILQHVDNAARPRVALVLGGGGLRGFAHIGVLRAIEEAGIDAEIVVGTSAGAVVGAAYASGMTPAEISRVAGEVRIASLIDLVPSSQGLMRGRSLAGWVDELTQGKPIEAFPRRFGAVATDLSTGEAVLIGTGTAGAAIQASAAVPGMNIPVSYPGGRLVDGGVASLVPVRFARALGADYVIAVDIYCNEPGQVAAGGALSIMARVMRTQGCALARAESSEADLLIQPAVQVPGMTQRASQERAIEAGYEAARAALRQISDRKHPALHTHPRGT